MAFVPGLHLSLGELSSMVSGRCTDYSNCFTGYDHLFICLQNERSDS
jgi:hypothetical protein